MLFYPVFRGLLCLNSVLPGTDIALYLLDRSARCSSRE